MPFFRDVLHEELSQGDIVRVCAYGSLPPVKVVVRWSKNPSNATVFDHPLREGAPKPASRGAFFSRADRPEEVVFEAYEGLCLVVSNDCVAIAKAANQALTLNLTKTQKSAPWHVAPLRPWPGDGDMVKTPDGEKPFGPLISAGKVKKYWELPARLDESGNEVVPHSYVDLRYLTPLQPATLRVDERMASLDDDGVGQLQAKLFTFFSGKSLTNMARCSKCGHSSELALDDLTDKETS